MKSIYSMSYSELKSMRLRLLTKSKLSGVERMHLNYADSIINDFEAKQRARARLINVLKGATNNGRCI